MFELFRVWLLVVSAAFVLGGVALVLFSSSPLAEPLHRLIDGWFWPAGPDAPTREFRTFVYGVLGGVISGWGLMMAIVVSQRFASREAWVWWSIALSVALWFALDTSRSIRAHVWVNVAGNLLFLIVIAIPLVGTYAEFH